MIQLSYPRGFLFRLLLISLIMMVPAFVFIYLRWTINTDLIVYAQGLRSFSNQFWTGDLYPRWLFDSNAGLGSPMFLFYGPLPFYVGSLFEPFAAFDPNGYARVIATFIPGIFLSGITSYRWLRLHFDESIAAKGAYIYAAFPYTIMCIYASFGLAHIWALAWLPYVLEGADELIRNKRKGFCKLSIAYAFLALTHIPTTLVFAVIPVLYAGHAAPRKQCLHYLKLAFLAGVLGAFLAAIYLLPAIANRVFVTSNHFLDGQLVYHQNFYHDRFKLGLLLILAPLLMLFIELPRAIKFSKDLKRHFWLWVSAAIFFMTTELSLPLWHALPPLQHLQFPFRFYSAMIPGVLFIVISWLPYVKSKGFYTFFGIICLIISAFFSFNDYFIPTPKYTKNIHREHLIIAPEYRTPWLEKAGVVNPRSLPESYTAKPAASLAEGSGKVEITAQSARLIRLKADISSEKALVEIKRFYFPGWQSDTGEIAEHSGLLAVSLPRGNHEVILSQPWFAGEKLGLMISLITGFGLLFLRNKRKTQEIHD